MLKNNLHAFLFVFGSSTVVAILAYAMLPTPEIDILPPINGATWQLPEYKQFAAAKPFNALTKGAVIWSADDKDKNAVVAEDDIEAKARNWTLMGFLQEQGQQYILVKLNLKKEATEAEKGKSSQLKRYQINELLPDDSKILNINIDHVVLQKMDETDIVYLYPQK
jgi:hypothetical protein